VFHTLNHCHIDGPTNGTARLDYTRSWNNSFVHSLDRSLTCFTIVYHQAYVQKGVNVHTDHTKTVNYCTDGALAFVSRANGLGPGTVLERNIWGAWPPKLSLPSLPPSPPLLPLYPPLPSPPSPPLSSPPLFSSLPPLEVGPLKSSQGVWGSAVSSPNGVWGGAPAEIEFGAF